jgi:hypothetical protein
MSFWIPLLLEMKLRFFTTLLNRSNDDEVQEEVMTWFKGRAADFYDSGIQKLVPRLIECLDKANNYVEK